MKQWIWGLVVGLCCVLGARAEAAAPVPLLWKAQQEGGAVYLLGSFHLLKQEDYPLHPVVDAIYAEVDRVVFEVDPAQMQDAEVQKALLRMARFEDGRTLRQVIAPQTAQKLQAFLGGSEAALAASDPFKPWYMGLNVSIGAMVAAGLDPKLGLDQHFMQRAARDGKAVAGLETVQQQLGAMDRAPLEEQEVMLVDALLPVAEMRERIFSMHDIWRKGDEQGLLNLVNEEMAQRTPQMYLLLNRDRNLEWLPQLSRMLKEKENTLVIVGAMHLLGDEGVVSLLRKQGIPVQRIKADAAANEADADGEALPRVLPVAPKPLEDEAA